VSMMVALKVMAYFKISLSTRNWDRAFFWPAGGLPPWLAALVSRAISPLPSPPPHHPLCNWPTDFCFSPPHFGS
ncbi:hypothetical protein, partial [Aeromonas jandaei]|uniref:hypothetical protein n=1 Tax=Aeromonas jandaei TaxID=650 RepID=UPI003BA0E9B4